MAPLKTTSPAKPSILSLQEIVRPILPDLRLVEETLKSVSEESEGILRDSSRYVLSGGGKRLRSALVLFCRSIEAAPELKRTYTAGSSAIQLAAAVELIHSATLVHDDIIDRAVLRRLQPTVNVQFGEEVAVLLGDFLYARAFAMIAGVGDQDVTAWMAETTQRMCEGELDQLKHRYRSDLSLEEYFSFIERKTAALIACCARAGGKLAGLPRHKTDALYSFGLNIGISYQIVDDLLDVVGVENKLGKTLRTDAGNGKMTLPMILLLQSAGKSQKEKFQQNFQSMSPDWKSIQALVEEHKIVEQTESYADQYYQKACDDLKEFSSPVRESLESLSRFVLNRDH